MINIRRGVFETNSSSSHTISITFNEDCDLDDKLLPDENGMLLIAGEDFTGIEFEIAGAQSKAALIATYIRVHGDDKLMERFESVLKEYTGAKRISYDIRFFKQLNGEKANTFYCPDIEGVYWYNENDDELSFTDILNNKKRLAKFIFGRDNKIEGGEIYC